MSMFGITNFLCNVWNKFCVTQNNVILQCLDFVKSPLCRILIHSCLEMSVGIKVFNAVVDSSRYTYPKFVDSSTDKIYFGWLITLNLISVDNEDEHLAQLLLRIGYPLISLTGLNSWLTKCKIVKICFFNSWVPNANFFTICLVLEGDKFKILGWEKMSAK